MLPKILFKKITALLLSPKYNFIDSIISGNSRSMLNMNCMKVCAQSSQSPPSNNGSSNLIFCVNVQKNQKIRMNRGRRDTINTNSYLAIRQEASTNVFAKNVASVLKNSQIIFHDTVANYRQEYVNHTNAVSRYFRDKFIRFTFRIVWP